MAQDQIPPNAPGDGTELKIGKYRLLERMGEGQFGYVYKAQRSDILEKGCYYAIKIIKSQYHNTYRRLLSDVKILQQLIHDGLAKFITTGWSSPEDSFAKYPYIVTEFIVGESWKTFQKYGPIAQDTLTRWAYEISDAIAYLHSHELEHGDLKSSNLQVVWTARHGQSVKILDAGIGQLCRNSQNIDPNNFRYLSPEQFAGKRGKASDVYSMGILLYEILSGSYPYESSETLDWQQWQQIHQLHTPKPLVVAGLPNTVTDIIVRCLEKDPSKRPNAQDVVNLLEKEITGIGIPSYIGILGARGSGKTCYLTSLYSQVESSEDTKHILEEKYIDLYENGVLPEATALSAYRLNFRITTEKRFYNIITKDYGGELLAGRRETTSGALDKDILLEKRQEIYEFFQNARAILILVETLPKEGSLRSVLNYRNEIYSLIDRIATVRDGIRRIEVPVGIILTKWDRIGKCSFDPEKERLNAIEYIKQVDWLRELYEQMKILCPIFEIFPAFSFIGDKPSKDDIKPFNLRTPLIWSTDQSDQSLLTKAMQFQEEHKDDIHAVVDNYWRLLHIEHICDPQIRKQLENILQELSPQYLKVVHERATKNEDNLRWVIGQYQEFLQTKGVRTEDKQEAKNTLEKYQKKLRIEQYRQMYRWAIVGGITFVTLLLLTYIIWEIHAEYVLRRNIISFDQSKLEPEEFLTEVTEYHKYQTLSPWRKFRDSSVRDEIKRVVAERVQREIRDYQIVMKEELPPSPQIISENFDAQDREKIVQARNSIFEKLRNAQLEEEKFQQRIQKVEELEKIQARWLKNFYTQLSNQELLPTAVRLQELKKQHIEWKDYVTYLESLKQAFVLKDELVQEKAKLFSRFSLETANDRPENCEQDLAQSLLLLQDLSKLQTRVQNYLRSYQTSPFQREVKEMDKEIGENQIKWQDYSRSLEKIKSAFLAKQNLFKISQTLSEQMELQKRNHRPENCEREIVEARGLMQEIAQLYAKISAYLQEYPNFPFQSETVQLQDDLTKKQTTWDVHCQYLQKIFQAFATKQDLLKESRSLFGQVVAGLISNKPEKWEENIATTKQLEQEIVTLQNKVQAYIQTYADSPFLPEIRQLLEDTNMQIGICQRNLDNLGILLGVHKDYLDLLRNAELAPSENDSLGLLRDKKDRLTKTMMQCREIQQKISNYTKIMPEEISRTWPMKCDEILPKINDNIRRANYYIAEMDFKELCDVSRLDIKIDDTPKTLEEKTTIAQTMLDNVAKYETTSIRFLPEDIAKLANRKKALQADVNVCKENLSKRIKILEELDMQIKEFTQQWQDILQKGGSYTQVAQKLVQMLQETNNSTYLANIHLEQLQQIVKKVQEFKALDLKQYQEIQNDVKSSRFLSAMLKIREYRENTKHYRVMTQELNQYAQNFTCNVTATIKVLPSPGFESNGPDFQLDVTTLVTTPSGEKIILIPTKSFSKNDIVKETEIGKITIAMKIMAHHLNIHITELDTISNDDYGNCEIKILDLLDNNVCAITHRCGRDGTLEMKIEPTQMIAVNELPKFKD